MRNTRDLSRRSFVKAACAAGASVALGTTTQASAADDKRAIKVGGFTKELQSLSYEETAEAARAMEWDGIECPVRPGGHVLPERVADDLPKMAEALEKRNLELMLMATAIHNPSEPHTEQVLRTAGQLGIPFYRIGYWGYDDDRSIAVQLDEIKPQLRDLAQMNQELGICGVFQNHSGGRAVGAPVWDIYELIKDLDPKYLGAHFDIGHATVEGGYAWPLHFRRLKSMIRAVVVKDFRWRYDSNGRGHAEWCPIGEGMIRPKFFDMLEASGFDGPITMHFEYEVAGGTPEERMKNLQAAMKKDGQVVRGWLA